MRAIIGTGRYAKTPYYFEKLGVHVRSMEELCYCLKENAFLLSADIMDNEILRFIEEECGLEDLARELYPIVHKNGSLATFVTIIMEYVGLYQPRVIQLLERTLRAGDGLSDYEKQKRRIDYLASKKRFFPALKAYEELYEWALEASEEELLNKNEFLTNVKHNQGVILANLFRYEEAAACFKEAYELLEKEDELFAFLAAKRMTLSDADYLEFVSGLMINYQVSVQLERRVEELRLRWQETPESVRLDEMKEWRESGEILKFEEESGTILHALKQNYRGFVGE